MATHNHVFSLTGDIIRNEYVGLYLISQMSYLKQKFTFSNMGTWPIIKELPIFLPVTTTGSIDYVYMEQYIRSIEAEKIKKLNTISLAQDLKIVHLLMMKQKP